MIFSKCGRARGVLSISKRKCEGGLEDGSIIWLVFRTRGLEMNEKSANFDIQAQQMNSERPPVPSHKFNIRDVRINSRVP